MLCATLVIGLLRLAGAECGDGQCAAHSDDSILLQTRHAFMDSKSCDAPIHPWTTPYKQLASAMCTDKLIAGSKLNSTFSFWNGENYKHFAQCRGGAAGTHGLEPMTSVILDHYSALKAADYVGVPQSKDAVCAANPEGHLIACNGWRTEGNCLQEGFKRLHKNKVTVWAMADTPQPIEGHSLEKELKDPNSRVSKMFIVNPRYAHEKIHSYPIGVYKAAAWPKRLDGREIRTDRKVLLECRGMDPSKQGRGAKLSALQTNGFQCEFGKRVGMDAFIDNMLNAKFVASPQGHGIQCHRDWEALLAGAVPIMDQPPPQYMDLYEGLPILFVKDWSVITPSFLEKEYARIQEKAKRGEYDMRRAYYPYWLRQILS